MGRPLVAVVDRPPGPKAAARLAHVVVADIDGPEPQWAEVASQLAAFKPAAVVALTERAVLPAAHLGAALGTAGVSIESARRCSDKRAMKRAARAAGLRCAEVVEAEEGLSASEIVERLGLPVVLKAAVSSGGRGTEIIHDAAEIPDRLPPGWMAESFVDGVEMSVETICLDDQPLLINPTQYVVPAWSSLVPAPLADRESVEAFAEAARRALGVRSGIAHLEVFLTSDGPVFGELAARPPGGHLMRLMELAYGIDPWHALFQVELGERPAMPESARQTAAVRILHPGPGRIHVADTGGACGLPGVQEVSIRVCPGDPLGVREGTGQEAGHVIVTGATPKEAEARLAAAVSAVRIEVGSLEPTG